MQEALIELGRHCAGLERVTVYRRICGRPLRLSLDPNRPSQRFILDTMQASGWYESETVNAIAANLSPGDTFFDVGAHCGYFSTIAAAIVHTFSEVGTVIAFEPNTDNRADLRRNCPSALVIEAAVCDMSGSVEFFTNSDNDGGHGLWPPGDHPHNKTSSNIPEATKSVRLDDFAGYYPTVIKIDTEGAECLVLRGATDVLKQPTLRLVVCEINNFGLNELGTDADEIFSTMLAHGFKTNFSKGKYVSNAIFLRP